MKRQFYNSVQWGIQTENIDKLRGNGFEHLRKIQCRTGKYYSLDIGQAIKKPEELDKIFGDELPFLILIEPNERKLEKIAEFNVRDKKILYKMIQTIPPESWGNYTISFVEQIMAHDKSFVGAAMSDGKGKLFIEFLRGTTNSKYLTSTGADVERLDTCEFRDFDTISQYPKHIPIELIQKIKDSCHFFKGYYEFIYGKSKEDKDIFFTYYSDIEAYLNLLKTNDEFAPSEITARLKYRYTREKQYLGDIQQIKSKDENEER